MTVEGSGLCHVCQVEGRKMVHEEEASRIGAQRELRAARLRWQCRRRETALQGAAAAETDSADPSPGPAATTS